MKSILESRDQTHPFLTMPYQKIFNQLLIFVSLYQQAKNETISLFWSREILQSDWLIVFWPISQEKDFCQYKICAGTQQII